MRHLANAQYWDLPAGGNTGRLFLAFGGPVCADRISNCPLDRVLTYKNLIYLLNLQICLRFRILLKLVIEFGRSHTGKHLMPRYFNIDRYRNSKYGLISIYIFVFDTNTTVSLSE